MIGPELSISAIPGLPRIEFQDDLGALILERAKLDAYDVVVVASTLISKAEGRRVPLDGVDVGEAAAGLAVEVDKDPRLVELVLRESTRVSRAIPGVLIVRNRLGVVSANAGIDRSNTGDGESVLLLPEDPDASARRLSETLGCAVVISDSLGRPFRFGTVGAAIGVAGLPALWDRRGQVDLDGRLLEHTQVALADQVAAAADLVMGQADEGRGVVVVRGLRFERSDSSAEELCRPVDRDLYL